MQRCDLQVAENYVDARLCFSQNVRHEICRRDIGRAGRGHFGVRWAGLAARNGQRLEDASEHPVKALGRIGEARPLPAIEGGDVSPSRTASLGRGERGMSGSIHSQATPRARAREEGAA